MWHQIIAIYLKHKNQIKNKRGEFISLTKKEKMKELKLKSSWIKLSTVLGFVFLSGVALASGSHENENLLTGEAGIIETQKKIKQHISFPNIILPLNKTEKVEVVFTTAENGKVNFVLAKTSNDMLKKQIEKQFAEMTLTKIKSNVAYSIVFNIKKI